jgi:hypothetical protein
MNKLANLALTTALVLAITLTFTACEEKKKQDGTTTTASEAEAAVATQEAVAGGITTATAQTITDFQPCQVAYLITPFLVIITSKNSLVLAVTAVGGVTPKTNLNVLSLVIISTTL